MRFILIITCCFGFTTLAFAQSESKSEGTSATHHTPHPPHDHPDNDHIKKLDEGLRKSRRKEQEEPEIGSVTV